MNEEELLQPKTFRDTIATVNESGSRKWVYALMPPFRKFYKARNILSYFYLLVFFGMPFIKVNGMPLLMINIPKSKFIIFSKIFWPQDFFIFAIAMIAMIVFIVLFTVVYGRLFCGWTCPQTIFMEFIFRKIEWAIEGSPSQQKKLDVQEKWTTRWFVKKISKHVIFFIVSFLIANTFLAYIIGIDDLFALVKEPVINNLGTLVGVLIFTFVFYFVYAYIREIVCTTICPYGRLQGVMFDKDTMQISYDYKRGEPRGILKKDEERTFGDCVDCKKCVQVCPTGIDIRNGVQLDCVGCSACVDACNEVMEKVNKPKGLIRYASENEISVGKKFSFSGRIKAYTILLAALIVFMTILIATRKTIDTYVQRARGQLYQEMPNNRLSNLYEAKIINKTNMDVPVTLKVEGMNGEIKLIGKKQIILTKEALNEVTFFLEVPREEIRKRSSKISIGVYDSTSGKKIQTVKTTFLGPFM